MITGKKIELRPVSLEDLKKTYDWRNDEETAKLEAGAGYYRHSHVPLEKKLRIVTTMQLKTLIKTLKVNFQYIPLVRIPYTLVQ